MLNQACGSFRVKINLSNKLLLARGSRGLGVVCDWGWHIYILLIIIHYCSSQSHPTLCVPLDCSLLNSVHEIFQARNTRLGCLFPPPGNLPDPWIESVSPALQADSLSTGPLGKPYTIVE